MCCRLAQLSASALAESRKQTYVKRSRRRSIEARSSFAAIASLVHSCSPLVTVTLPEPPRTPPKVISHSPRNLTSSPSPFFLSPSLLPVHPPPHSLLRPPAHSLSSMPPKPPSKERAWGTRYDSLGSSPPVSPTLSRAHDIHSTPVTPQLTTPNASPTGSRDISVPDPSLMGLSVTPEGTPHDASVFVGRFVNVTLDYYQYSCHATVCLLM